MQISTFYSVKGVFLILEISQNSEQTSCARVSFLVTLQVCLQIS